ncbi:hypothetical protein [Enterococcus faecalis]|uniref:hypothetical protein n=1 Tax=Enterococcus faecalis TaxID=1351 RepID=UPI00115DE225|nr:hypothetical protein [Enterococcus faecalis]
MKKEDLIEFLSSTIEEDAIVSRLYHLFHIEYKYKIKFLNNLIQYGVEKKYFSIVSVTDSNKIYTEVEWKSDNNYQEIVMNNHEEIVECLFSNNPCIPKDFMKFVNNK